MPWKVGGKGGEGVLAFICCRCSWLPAVGVGGCCGVQHADGSRGKGDPRGVTNRLHESGRGAGGDYLQQLSQGG